MMKRLILLSLALGAVGCATGLAGQWDASGEIEQRRLFNMGLSFEDEANAKTSYADRYGGDPASRSLAICSVSMLERDVKFVFDPTSKAGTQCAALAKPLTFKGTLGHDVLVGDLHDAAGKRVGMLRAFRKPQP